MAALFKKYKCVYCQEIIEGHFIQCCSCEYFDICLECFRFGAEIGPHKNDHPYKFVDSCATVLVSSDSTWNWSEEYQLMAYMEQYGYGSWEAISKKIMTKTPEEVKNEYVSRYEDGTIAKFTWQKVDKVQIFSHVKGDTGPYSSNAIEKLPAFNLKPAECKLLGYLPLRDEYKEVYDPAAENLISNLQIEPDQNEIQTSVQLLQVDLYQNRLRERAKRHRIARDYQLAPKFFSIFRKNSNYPKLTKQQNAFRDRMRTFCQFQTSNEHNQLIKNLEQIEELRTRLKELIDARMFGLTTQEEIIHYNQHDVFKESKNEIAQNNS